MTYYLFVFFAGIALSIGLIEIWLGFARKKFKTDFLFGIFALSAGIYYLCLGVQLPNFKLLSFFAVSMFALFPWYYAMELGFVKKSVLWLITGLCAGYFIVVLLDLSGLVVNFVYVFSYSVYVLTTLYCLVGLANIRNRSSFAFYPFLIVSLYYTIFIMEEMAFNYYGMQLPWRRGLNFNYLDLFPMIIILNKFVLIIRDQWNKGALERTLSYYRENLNLVLHRADKLMVVLDPKGEITYANPAFYELIEQNKELKNTPLLSFLPKQDQNQFIDKVINGQEEKGDLMTVHATAEGTRTIAWSFIRLDDQDEANQLPNIYLFGSDITKVLQTESQLQQAYNDLKLLKNKLEAENIQLRSATDAQTDLSERKLLGQSPIFRYVLNRVEDVASLDIPVLLEGETGVGKELFANAIHENSHRRHKPFIKINCAAIPGELLESELFGYEKGAFTGAEKTKLGVFELADSGTLFLDEIGELPLPLQPKLLRAIQENEIKRLGAEKNVQIDVRLIAATNRNLLDEVEQGRFRSDFYYRINVFPITVPSLRQRKEDIPLLVEFFVDAFNKKYSKDVRQVSESLMDELKNYSWPGNVRQLRNVIERAVITSSETLLKLAAALPKVKGTESISTNEYAIDTQNVKTLEEFERDHITRVLNQCKWKISGKASASEILDLPPSTLRSKMKKLGILTRIN